MPIQNPEALIPRRPVIRLSKVERKKLAREERAIEDQEKANDGPEKSEESDVPGKGKRMEDLKKHMPKEMTALEKKKLRR